MSSKNLSRRKFLKVAAVAAASAAVASVPGVFDLFSKASVASAAPNAATLQANLAAFANLRFGMYIHFNMGTFTNEEWATPNQNPLTFAPTNVDCAQWAAAAVSAHMGFGALTTKHHDGFCLWPTAYTSYNVMNSGYKQDIVKKYTDAFRAAGLKVGLYYSIWDKTQDVQAYETRHAGIPAGSTISQADITYTLNQLTELLSNYGKIDVLITDGYAWQMGQQAMPYQQIRELVKSLQPDCVMLDHSALSQPWGADALVYEEPLGITCPANNTYPADQENTITPAGWFWHPADPTTDPMTLANITSHLTNLEPKWCNFLLNCPPNRTGQLDANIVTRLAQVGAAWSPNSSRAALPTQQFRTEHPVTPVTATATFSHTGEGPTNAIDGLSDKNYETCWSSWSTAPTLPQSITVDLGGIYNNISTLEYLPKQWNRNNSTDGDITSYTIFVSSDGSAFTQVATGAWTGNNATTKLVEWANTNARYVKLQANAATGGYVNVSALTIGGRSAKPVIVGSGPTSTPLPPTATPTITPTPVPGSNLAQGKTASADSSQTANPAASGNDGSTTTRWCANDGNLNHWWKVDLGASHALTGSEEMWEKSGVIYKYKVEVSTDNTTWTLKVDKTANTSTAQTQTDAFTATARYVRITVTGLASGAWASFFEFRVFGT